MKFFNANALILMLLSIQLNAQQHQIKGVIKDIATLQPIAGATLSSTQSNNATISNEEGAFEFVLPTANDTLVVSYVGYKEYKIAVNAIKETELYLESKTNELEEVIVIKEGIQELLERIIAKSKAQFTTPLVMDSYFREFVKVNNRYTKFSDGDLLFLLNRKSKSVVSQLNVRQVRAFQIPKTESDGSESVFDDINSAFKIYELPASVDNFKYIEKTILKNKDFNKYEFLLKSKVSDDGSRRYTLYFNPIDEVKEYLFKGYITFDPETDLIYTVHFAKDPAKISFANDINILLFRLTLLEQQIHANYRMVNNDYVMSNFSVAIKLNIKNKKKYNDDIEMKSDMLVTHFSKNTSAFDVKNTYKGKSLYELGTRFTTPFWKNNNAILLTDKEIQVIKSLEKQE